MSSEFRFGEDARAATIQSLANTLELIDRSKRAFRRATGRAGLPLPSLTPPRPREDGRPSTADLLLGALQTQLKAVNGLVERGLQRERGLESLIERLARKVPAGGVSGVRASMSLRAHPSAGYVRHSFVIQNFVRPDAHIRIELEPFQGPRPSLPLEVQAVLRWASSLEEEPATAHNRWSPRVAFDQSAELVLELPLAPFARAGADPWSSGERGHERAPREVRRHFESLLRVDVNGESRREIVVLLDLRESEET